MGPVAQGFADLEERLLETRRSIGLPSEGTVRAPSALAPAPATATTPSVPDRSGPRRHVGDLVLLGVAWGGFLVLVLLAL